MNNNIDYNLNKLIMIIMIMIIIILIHPGRECQMWINVWPKRNFNAGSWGLNQQPYD